MFRSFAIIPAAGRSVRMGRQKLLMPWGDATLIETGAVIIATGSAPIARAGA